MELCSYLWIKYILKQCIIFFPPALPLNGLNLAKTKSPKRVDIPANHHYFEAEIFDKIHKKQLWVFYNIAVIYWSVSITSYTHFRTILHRRNSIFDFNEISNYTIWSIELWSGNTILMLKSLKFIISYNLLSPFSLSLLEIQGVNFEHLT